ncbi:MAG: mitochondrial fission ELM1 family protein [Gammaproteobacteria bacterium]|jgi:mitochondrial fission protein ELM1|nr:mitochondrial fission ELM1 family protein [Gammaproteobacteria bacterium]MBP6051171.1 mitochondrial fission ELM1 family protein [Pseudomonadales bacterium]MBK6584276.1 mitochondrial fission ELM1 family protein [Gammaproteobacteria bacterium]MBK7520459.1 mitochondrial fission ELM1 family protein [Gammaproteobacteria bacterium]MBK7728056.1 mitochondrial fission ELM1 family protein [Gammaproteobacteria bacterium]
MPCEDTKSPSPARPLIWLLLSDKQGDNKQVFSLADRLGCAYETRFVFPKPGFVKGKPWFRPSIAHIDLERSDRLGAPWPDLIITIGRRPGMVALWIRARSKRHTRIILIGRQPRYLREFALVISSCQYITADDPRIMRIALPLDNEPQRGRQPDLPPGSAQSTPGAGELAVLIGGPTRSFRLGEAEAMELLKLACEQRAAAAIRFVTSRRTPAAVVAWIAGNLPPHARLCQWSAGAHTTSDYANALAQCDRFIVTGDSISMICDVVREGKALAIYRLPFRNAIYDYWHRFILAVAPIDDGHVRSGLLAALLKRVVDSRIIRLPRSFDAFYSYLEQNGCASDIRRGFLPSGKFMPEQDLERATERTRAVLAMTGESPARDAR